MKYVANGAALCNELIANAIGLLAQPSEESTRVKRKGPRQRGPFFVNYGHVECGGNDAALAERWERPS